MAGQKLSRAEKCARTKVRNAARKEEKQKRVAEITAARATRTPAQQLATLDRLLGKGKGAKKERARLAEQIANPPAKKGKV